MKIYCILVAFCAFTALTGVEYAEIPKELQGSFPIHEPDYNGVDQILVLSSKWIIVATRNLPELIDEIEKLSGNTLLKEVAKWEASEKAGRPDWKAYRERWHIRDRHIAQARENIGERELDTVDYYSISSTTDKHYAGAKKPHRVTRLLIPLSGQKVKGSHGMDYAHYSYLEMPQPLITGETYSITLKNKKSVTFLFDEQYSVSRAIKINQVGYMPQAKHKYAYLGCHLFEFGAMDCSAASTFSIVDVKTGKSVFDGKPILRKKMQRFQQPDGSESSDNPLISGEDVYELDFGSLQTEGVYFIKIPGIGRSWPFKIHKNVYGDAFYISMRGLYHQRASFALEEQYTPWSRKRHHTEPIYESEAINGPRHGGGFAEANKIDQNQFDIIGGSIDKTKSCTTVEGGWYDAADWDRNGAHYVLIFDMLTAFQYYPDKFTDGQLHFNESNNGIPDILDEVEWGLRIWRYSQDERGGVSGKVETWTHPAIDAKVDYAFGQRTRWSSLVYAAAAAQFAELVAPFNKEISTLYKNSAIRAYQFGADANNRMENITVHGKKKRGKGDAFTVQWTESDELSYPYLCHAKLRLYLLTNDDNYLKDLESISKKAHKPFSWKFTHKDWSAWIYFDILSTKLEGKLKPAFIDYWKNIYFNGPPIGSGTNGMSFVGENLISATEAMPYRNSLPLTNQRFGWGSSISCNRNRSAFIAHVMSNDERYRDVMRSNADFCFGANPMGMSWTTGIGFTYPIHFQHAHSEDDAIMDPVPGITVYGITSGPRFHQFRNNVWTSPGPNKTPISFMKKENTSIPAFRRWGAHPMLNTAKCEFTIHETMSATIFTAACLMPNNWKPSKELKQLKPRKDQCLYGFWYLP